MADPLQGIRAKLDRAGEHLSTIEIVADRWAKRSPCEVVMDCDVQTHEHHFRLRVFEPPPADDLDIPISECVHNRVSALDQIVYRLAVYVGGDPPPNEANSGFPICSSPKHLTNSLPSKIGKPKLIPPPMRTALESAQAYEGGDAVNLPVLQDLNDCDKHRFPPLLAAIGQVVSLNIGTFSGSSFAGPRMGPLEDGASVLSFTPAPDAIVDMELNVLFAVAFGSDYPGHGAYVGPFLETTLGYIRDTILPSLAAFL